mgnify:CR=1 FL=1
MLKKMMVVVLLSMMAGYAFAAVEVNSADQAAGLESKAEVEQVRTEGVRNAFAVAAGICFLAALAMALLGQYLRAGAAFLIGGAIGSLPFVFNSPYFLPAVGLLIVVALVFGWLQFRKPTCPDAPQESKEG